MKNHDASVDRKGQKKGRKKATAGMRIRRWADFPQSIVYIHSG